MSTAGVGKGCLVELKSLQEFTSVLRATEPVLVDFSALWCGPCKVLSPILEEVAARNKDVRFIKVDIDKFPSLANDYNVSSVPYVALFRNEKIVGSFLGAKNATSVQRFLDDHK